VAGRPLVLNNVQAKGAIIVNVGMEDLGCEPHTWRLLRIPVTESDPYAEDTSFPRRFLRPKNTGVPDIHVIFRDRGS